MPTPCARALDVGCGEGSFARRLAALAEHVDGIERSDRVVAAARVRSQGFENLRFIHGDFLEHAFEPESYDFITALASLHHMPFARAIERMKALLRPRGVLGVVGLFREENLTDLALSALAWPVRQFHRVTQPTAEPMNAPIRAPSMSWREIREQTAELLPGSRVRRRLLWRYTLIWTRPG
jgi:SAM-dependent methyltransferase